MADQTILNERVLSALEKVVDPELGIDIVNLGLIYGVEVAEATGVCTITMTLTIAGCPLSDYLEDTIEQEVSSLDEVNEVKINLVWEPAWSIEKMSREARIELGIH